MTLIDSAIADNTNVNPGTGLFNDGGTALLINSAVTGNTTTHGSGAGIMNANGGDLTLVNCTVSDNSAVRSTGWGGGLLSSRGRITLINSTVARNAAGGRGGGIAREPLGRIEVRGSIIADNEAADEGPDCSVGVVSLGYNLIGDSSGCNFVPTATDLLDVDPLLGSLQDNGGPTLTHGLHPGSPAIDAGGDECEATDQRGVARPQGPACDIGAFEVVVPDPVELLASLIDQVTSLSLPHGLENALLAKLDSALLILTDLQPDNDHAAANRLRAFVHHVEAQYGKKVPADDADALIGTAEQIIGLLTEELEMPPGSRQRMHQPGQGLGGGLWAPAGILGLSRPEADVG